MNRPELFAKVRALLFDPDGLRYTDALLDALWTAAGQAVVNACSTPMPQDALFEVRDSVTLRYLYHGALAIEKFQPLPGDPPPLIPPGPRRLTPSMMRQRRGGLVRCA